MASTQATKKRKAEEGNADKEEEIANLKAQVSTLQKELSTQRDYTTTLYASADSQVCAKSLVSIPSHGMNPRHIMELINSVHDLDFNPRLNTSSVSCAAMFSC